MNLLYTGGRLASRLFFQTYLRWQVFYPERIPREGPLLLASNHASFLDPPLIGAASPRPLYYLARHTLFQFAPFGWLLRHWNTVPVDRDRGGPKGLKTVLDLINRGRAVVLFPEGTRSPDGSLRPARPGIGFLVAKTSCPILPVRVFNTWRALGKGMTFPRPTRVAVKFGRPMRFEALRAEAARADRRAAREIRAQIARQIMEAIAALEPRADA